MRDGARHGHEAHRGAGADANADTDAAAAFASRVRADHGDAIRDLVAVGDAVRGDDRGVHSSVELLVVLEDGVDEDENTDDEGGDSDEAADTPTLEEREQQLEALAETVGIEHEVVLAIYVLPADRVDAQQDHPLVREALENGRSYV